MGTENTLRNMTDQISLSSPFKPAPRVCVIMSVYNGSRYLRQQVDSILAQENVDIHLFVRDDGSTDDTVAILKSYQSRVTVVNGKNKGAAMGFMEAAFAAPKFFDYYAFSDADDVWLPEKTITAVRTLGRFDAAPALAFCRMQLVDEALNPLRLSFKPTEISFRNALIQTSVSGAATTMNAAMFSLLRSKRPRSIVMHDAWLYLIASVFGSIIFLEDVGVLYRQHTANVFGGHGGQGRRRVWIRRLEAFRRPNLAFRLQASEFLRLYGDQLPRSSAFLAERFVAHPSRISRRLAFALRPRLRFNTVKSSVYYRCLALLGRT